MTPNRAASAMMPAGQDGLRERIVRIATLGATDPDGRPLWVTARWYDAKAPRAFALGPAGMRRLGTALLGMLALVCASLIGFLLVGLPMILILGALGAAIGRNAAAATTPWIDRFEQLPTD